jgi:Hyaluronan / mRNA binding family
VVRDRSLSRTGLDKSIRKNGAGQHNWGCITDEAELEFAALKDEELEFAADATENAGGE